MEKEPITPVLFLIHPDDPEVFAYFPDDKHNESGTLRSCYQHIGQHSPCAPEYARECIEATEEEYQDLKKELENQVGYRLWILNGKPKSMEHAIRKIDWKQLVRQKRTLNLVIQTVRKEVKDDLLGVLHLIDSIQDFAVDDYGYSEKEVFNTEKE